MKKLFLSLVLALGCMHFAYADNTANIRIKISGTTDNRYFLCLPNVGCLSIRAAQRGKIYPIYGTVGINQMFVANLRNNRLSPQGLPSSCDVTVNPNQTITIYGNLVPGSNNSVHINNFHCALS